MSVLQKDPVHFAPMVKDPGVQGAPLRPYLSFWQEAWRRLKCNRLALVAGIYIMTLALSAVLGPSFFPPATGGLSYENIPNLDRLNQGPTWGKLAVVVPDVMEVAPPGRAPEALPPSQREGGVPLVDTLQVVGSPNTNGIELGWQPVEGVQGYKIYRLIATSASEIKDPTITQTIVTFGNVLADLGDPLANSYTDPQGLEAGFSYMYAVVPYLVSSRGKVVEAPRGAVTIATPKPVEKLSTALLQHPNAQVGDMVKQSPRLFGSDHLGRDVLARMVQGARVDLILALLVPSVALVVGLLYGCLAAIVGGKVDLVMMRIVEILDSLPTLLMLILLQVYLGKGFFSLVLALCAFAWTSYARIVRGEVLRLKAIEFVQASQLLGAPLYKVVGRHIAPNLFGVLIVLWSGHIPNIITAEAFLSLLGLGLEVPDASWGTVLYNAGGTFQLYPFQFFLPAIVMGLTLLSFFVLGDALRDAFDPKVGGGKP